jgi:hypothetical protein
MAESTTQAPDSTTRPTDVSRQVGETEVTASPIAEAKVISTKKPAAATMAPQMHGPQFKYGGRIGAALLVTGLGPSTIKTLVSDIECSLMQS